MLNSIKTENQRMTVEIGMDCIMPRIEIANDILYDAWEEFFGNVPQQSISALESERLGRILYAAFDMTSNAKQVLQFITLKVAVTLTARGLGCC